MSLSCSIFQFKSAVVKPLLNKPTLDSAYLKNYRPVSYLFFSKLVEHIIANCLVTHLSFHNLLAKFQLAYCKFLSPSITYWLNFNLHIVNSTPLKQHFYMCKMISLLLLMHIILQLFFGSVCCF